MIEIVENSSPNANDFTKNEDNTENKEEINEENQSNVEDIEKSIIEEDLKNFEILNENEKKDESSETSEKEITEETTKIMDLLESLILVMLFIMAMRHKGIENKQKVVMDFVNERKELIKKICINMEKSIARNVELYKKLQKFNDISFVIQLVILTLEFEGILNDMEKKGKSEKKETKIEKKSQKNNNEVNKTNKIEVNESKITTNGAYSEVW
ncbi:Exonuclease SbcC [Methanocaldococcus lauensis]|uniref:Exonuclease SbcC n=1 Tax=Methanocaldococcus lauensis TaxID=2546128 RepID=A0A8D6PQJ1_9EURY|nr:hypothetical protein [Methanocaldococcus lauensis]CAB3288205.1 Exonuclease SbcC [Methanocaldococcus lauensis]